MPIWSDLDPQHYHKHRKTPSSPLALQLPSFGALSPTTVSLFIPKGKNKRKTEQTERAIQSSILPIVQRPAHNIPASLKGTAAWDGFFAHCILSRNERKDLTFFYVVPIFTELAQDLTHLAHTENTQREIILWERRKILIAFCSLGTLL